MAKKIQDGNQIVTNVDSNDNLTFSIKSSFIDSTPTTNSTNLVTSGGVKSALDINTTDINNLETTVGTLSTNVNANTTKIGTLSNLTTTSKTNLVSAINELNAPEKWVSVGTTAPTDGRRVWFAKGKNLIGLGTQLNGYVDASNLRFIVSANSIGYFFETSKLPNTITFSCVNGNRGNVCYFNEIPQSGATAITRNPSNDSTRTITIDKTYSYVHIQFSYNYLSVTNIQVEEGSTATTYEPSIEKSINVDDESFISMSDLVSVGVNQPSDGKRVWFKKGQNLFDASTIVAGDITGADPTIRLSSRQPLYLKNGTYTFSTNQVSPFRYSIQVQNVGVPPLSSYPTYILNSGWQTSSSYTFTLTNPGYVVVNISKNDNATITPSEISSYNYQIKEGSTATDYEPYVDEGIYVDEEELHFNNYSLDEQVIGKWIDGKPIYRKTYQVTNISSSNADLVDISGLNIDTIIKLYGFVRSNPGMCMPMPLTDSSSNYNVIFIGGSKIRGRVAFGTGGSVRDCYITIEYTKKTTD